MIQAALFDLDGLLIDSEPLWEEATMLAYKEIGIDVTLDMCYACKGMRIDDAIKYIYDISPWEQYSFKEVELEILNKVEILISTKGIAKEGVNEILDFCKQHNLKTAVASSSMMRVIKTALKKLGLENFFNFVHSAEFEEYGKPHPAIYLTTAKKIGIEPQKCLVFEDAIHGVIAGKAAQMKVVAVPDSYTWKDTRFDIADIKLKSLIDFNNKIYNKL